MAAKMKARSLPSRAPARKTPASRDSVMADALGVALRRAFGMSDDDASEVARIVAERFAGEHEVNDETLDADLRSLFYTLEAKRLLSFRRTEYDNDAGEKRRAFFWRIRSETVAELCAPEPVPRDEDVYADLPAECWRRDAPAEA